MKFVFMLLYVLNFSGKIVFVGVCLDWVGDFYQFESISTEKLKNA